jgi:hypothetical protein
MEMDRSNVLSVNARAGNGVHCRLSMVMRSVRGGLMAAYAGPGSIRLDAVWVKLRFDTGELRTREIAV